MTSTKGDGVDMGRPQPRVRRPRHPSMRPVTRRPKLTRKYRQDVETARRLADLASVPLRARSRWTLPLPRALLQPSLQNGEAHQDRDRARLLLWHVEALPGGRV
jgi:hypothetical protein